jgi:hypothetical protein
MGLGPRAEPGRWRVWLAARAKRSSVVRRPQARQSAQRQFLGLLPPARPRHSARSGMGYSSARPPTLQPVARARHTCAHDRPAEASLVALRPLHASRAQYPTPWTAVGTGLLHQGSPECRCPTSAYAPRPSRRWPTEEPDLRSDQSCVSSPLRATGHCRLASEPAAPRIALPRPGYGPTPQDFARTFRGSSRSRSRRTEADQRWATLRRIFPLFGLPGARRW